MSRVLVVEDDRALAMTLLELLRRLGFEVEHVASATEALQAVQLQLFEVILLDLGLPDLDGLEVISELYLLDPALAVVVHSARDEAESAIRALRSGATDYLVKPAPSRLLQATLKNAIARSEARRQFQADLRKSPSTPRPLGTSARFVTTLQALEAAARSPRAPVLLLGETGSGKEVLARYLHRCSSRRSGAFVAVNAGALPEGLIESEIFGHEAGAFSGARGARRGLLEMAKGGTLFLDEIAELPLTFQAKLLRVLDGHAFRRVGGEREVECDFRLVSATNRSLEEGVRTGRFRADLYHRIRVVELAVPPLRERGEDIRALAEYFLESFSLELARPGVRFSDDFVRRLEAHSWPGNVRELRNVIERALLLATDSVLELETLPRELAGRGRSSTLAPIGETRPPDLELLSEVSEAHVARIFADSAGNLSKAARRLGISRVALRRRLSAMGRQTDQD